MGILRGLTVNPSRANNFTCNEFNWLRVSNRFEPSFSEPGIRWPYTSLKRVSADMDRARTWFDDDHSPVTLRRMAGLFSA